MKKRKFQWVKSEKIGQIETLDKILVEDGVEFYIFDVKNQKEKGNRMSSLHIGKGANMLKEIVSDADLLNPDLLNNKDAVRPNAKQRVQAQVPKQYGISNLIADQLNKGNQLLTIKLELPILKVEFFNMIQETYPETILTLTDIIYEKYINQEHIKESVKKELLKFYNTTDIVNIETNDAD